MIKHEAWRSPKYLKWVKTLPCCSCGNAADDPHHLIGMGNMGGMGMKAPDSMVMPMCRQCHQQVHQSPTMQEHQWEWICRTLAQAIDEGVIKIA